MTIKKDVKKHSSIIQVTHRNTLLEQHLFNALLAEAEADLQTKNIHAIDIAVLKEYVPGIHSVAKLKKMLKNLVDVTVEYNIFEKDKEKEWGVASLLASGRIGKFSKICYFAFAPDMIPFLSDPKMYARINLILAARYKGGQYGWDLYELCWDYRNIGKTKEATIEEFKKFFGIPLAKYKDYRDFRRRVLNFAIKEVNTKTDLLVTLETKREGRSIKSLIFHIKKNPKFKKLINITPSKPIIKLLEKGNIWEILKDFKISKIIIKNIRAKYDDNTIEKALEICRKNEDNGTIIEHPGHYLKRILASMDKPQPLPEAPGKDEQIQQKKDKLLYQNLTLEERFEELLKRQSKTYQNAYKDLSEDKQKLFRAKMYTFFEQYQTFKSVNPKWGLLLTSEEF